MLGVLVILSLSLSLRLSNEIPYSHLYVLQHKESKLIYKKTFFLNVLSLYLSLSLRVSLSLSSPSVHPPSSYLTSLSHIIFENMAHVGSFSHFVFVIVFVFVFVFACVFVIVITFGSSAIIIFVILESYHFRKYGTCWVF